MLVSPACCFLASVGKHVPVSVNAVPDSTACCKTSGVGDASDQSPLGSSGPLRSTHITGITADAVMRVGELAAPSTTAAGARGSSDADEVAGAGNQASYVAVDRRSRLFWESIAFMQPSSLESRPPVIGRPRYPRETALGRGACKGDSFVFSRAAGRSFLHGELRVFFCFPQPFAFLQVFENAYLLL